MRTRSWARRPRRLSKGRIPTSPPPLWRAATIFRKLFYFGESVLKRAYRGRGIGHAFFDQRETAARATPGVELATFSGVVRSPADPRRDPSYRPLDAFWKKRGYAPVEGLVGHYSWTDIGDKEQTRKPMQFWMRRL